jgi:hypothetical protein
MRQPTGRRLQAAEMGSQFFDMFPSRLFEASEFNSDGHDSDWVWRLL